jgi:hypothetical protein
MRRQAEASALQVAAEFSLATAALLHSTSVRLAHVAMSIVAVHRNRGELGVFVGAAYRTPNCDEDAKRRRGSLPGAPSGA